MPYIYRCREYPGMEDCPGEFVADSKQELQQHIELHAAEAHGENPAVWSAEEREIVQGLVHRVGGSSPEPRRGWRGSVPATGVSRSSPPRWQRKQIDEISLAPGHSVGSLRKFGSAEEEALRAQVVASA